MSLVSENKRLARNTLLLYIRMVLTMTIGLYTSRVVLQVLGVSDFGVFNVVGGMVSMFSFVNTALTGSTQRFLTYSLGKNDITKTTVVFKVSLTLHLIISLSFLALMLVIGTLMLKYVLNIPEGREVAALWVFLLCTCSLSIDLIRLIFDAEIIANEKMDFYAYMSVVEVMLKLFIVYILAWYDYIDKLKLYAVLYFISTFTIFLISAIYSIRKFKECKIGLKIEKGLFREIGAYMGWNIVSHVSYMLSSQGINVALNVFLGTIVNAARGISVQVYGAISKLTSNYLVATVPQIIKLYAAGNINEMYTLVKNVSKFSMYLYILVAIPIFVEMDYVLRLWLTEVPNHTVVFARIMIIQGGIIVLSNPLTRILSATGKIKRINLVDLFIQTLVFLVILILLFTKISVDVVMMFTILPKTLSTINYLYAARLYTGVNIKDFFTEVLLKVSLILCVVLIMPLLVFYNVEEGIARLLAVTASNTFGAIFAVYYLGIEPNTRQMCITYVRNKLHALFFF